MSLGYIEGAKDDRAQEGMWLFGEDDWTLMALLQDPIHCAELLFEDPLNREYHGCYQVRDYQYPLFRPSTNYQIFPCARDLGKTESIKARTVSHLFKRMGEDLLLSAPELIHLEPLTQAIEARITEVRLTRDFLRRDAQRTGFTHKPFQCDAADGTRIIGRIPKITGPQPLHARLATPYGWTTMGEIEQGDVVLGSDGRATEVLEVHEKGWQDVYRLHFSDNTWVEATADHRLPVSEGKGGLAEEMTVGEIDKWTRRWAVMPHASRTHRPKLYMPDAVPIHYEIEPTLPLDPWLVGVLIGDGGVSQHTIGLTNPEPEIVADADRLLRAMGCKLEKRPERDCHYYVTGVGRGVKVPLRARLEELGLMGCTAQTKRIPPAYMVASLDERLALLQGLLDTDGHCSKTGKVTITLDNRELVEQVTELVRSLGGWASLRQHVVKPRWQKVNGKPYYNKGGMYWQTNIDLGELPPFRLPRKLERCRERVRPRGRAIDSVESMGRYDTRCISVAAVDKLYLSDHFHKVYNTGVKGQHVPDLMIDEAQDYPDKGWVEVFPTVLKDHTGPDGEYDFTMHYYGVHSSGQGGHFGRLAESRAYKVTAITALQKPGWNKAEKAAAKAMYGGSNTPDYRRNILGERGTSLSAMFATARLMACMDQDVDSKYNTAGFKHQEIHAEEMDKIIGPDGDPGDLLDLPEGLGQQVYGGMDIGLVVDPTVIQLWAVLPDEKKKPRLTLVRMFHLWRFREKQIRQVTYRIARQYGITLRAFGQDITGLGLPLYQAMEDDEQCPEHLKEVARGYTFNAKVPVAVDKDYVSKQGGSLVDQYGHIVEEVTDKWTGRKYLVAKMTMIEASTRYLRGFVDNTYLRIPFHEDLFKDFQGETEQRVKAMGGMKKKPSAFHMLDAARAFAMAYKAGEVEEQVYARAQSPVFDRAVGVAAQ